MKASTWAATGVGALALILWAVGALLIVSIGQLPIFEIQFIIFSCSFLLAFSRITLGNRWSIILSVPKIMWLFGVMGIYLANFFFVSAFQYAAPEKVDLINYLWPMIVILFSPLFLKEKLKANQLIGIIVAFIGIFILLTEGQGLSGFNYTQWRGYLLSFLNALFWSLYILVSKRYSSVPNEMIGLYAGVAAICSIIGHCLFETFIFPSKTQLIYLIILGITGQGLAYICWDHGMKMGHYKFLCVLTYLSPIVSIILLIYFGYAAMSEYLLWATLMVTIGAFITMPGFFSSLLEYLKWGFNKPQRSRSSIC